MDYDFVPFLISSYKIQIYHIKYESHSSFLSMGMLVQNRERAELSRAEDTDTDVDVDTDTNTDEYKDTICGIIDTAVELPFHSTYSTILFSTFDFAIDLSCILNLLKFYSVLHRMLFFHDVHIILQI